VKDYIIWFSSGRCSEGSMDDREAEKLRQAFKNKSEHPGIFEFTDTDGILLVEMSKVDAVSINDSILKEGVGFKTETL